MANDIWTPPTDWNTGTNFTEVKAEAELTDNINVLSLAIDGDTSASTIKHRHRSGTYATLLTIAAGEVGRWFLVTDMDCWFYDDGTRWQPAWGMHGKNCDSWLEDFHHPAHLWTPSSGGTSIQGHTINGDSSVWQLVTGSVTNDFFQLSGAVNWHVGRFPAWFECRIKDASASRLQSGQFIGFLGYDLQNGFFFDKNSAGSESDWVFRVRRLGVDVHTATVAGSAGAGWNTLRFVLETATQIKSYFGDTLLSTYTGGAGMPSGTWAPLIKMGTLESAQKIMHIDKIGLIAKRA